MDTQYFYLIVRDNKPLEILRCDQRLAFKGIPVSSLVNVANGVKWMRLNEFGELERVLVYEHENAYVSTIASANEIKEGLKNSRAALESNEKNSGLYEPGLSSIVLDRIDWETDTDPAKTFCCIRSRGIEDFSCSPLQIPAKQDGAYRRFISGKS